MATYKDPAMWFYPRIHNFEFGFGLSADAATKASTIQPWMMMNDSIEDYELIKTNPENDEFAVVAFPDVAAGSVVPRIMVDYSMYIPSSDTQLVHLMCNTMRIHTAMKNRIDAFDKKTGDTTQSILELEGEATDTICYPLYNGTKLFEAGGTFDTTYKDGFADVGLGTDLQPEGVAFTKETFFDAMHYYTNKEMLRVMTDRMKSYVISEPLVSGRSVIHVHYNYATPSLCKFANPYMFCGELFHVPQSGSIDQYHIATETTAIEHLRVKGRIRFNEYNTDWNFARA